MAHEDPHNESVTGVIGKIVDDVRELFREEVALARAEIRQEISGYSVAAMELAAGAVAGGLALLFFLLFIAQGFAMLVHWPVWAGYLAVAIVLGIAAAAALYAGRARARTVPAVPPRTVETLKETKEWINNRMNSEPR
jgi:uncharacterized membrane protein YqjE